MYKLGLGFSLGLLLIGAVQADGYIRPQQFPLLYNQVFGSVTGEVQSNRIDEYKIPLAEGQTLYLNVISPTRQAYVYVPAAAKPEETGRPIERHWQGKLPGVEVVTVQVWSNYPTGYILEATRK